MSLLRSYLEANAILTAADLEVAVRHQQGQGGSLDTALLELGLLTAAELDLHLGKACGLPTVPARLLETGPARPWQSVPKALVDIGWAMPLAIEDGNVMVAVHPDLPDARLGQLYRQIRGFMPMVAPECCLAKLAAERSNGIVAPRHAMLVLDVLDALQARDAPTPPQDTLTGVAVPTIQLRSEARPDAPPAPPPALTQWVAPPAPRDLYVDSGATAVLPVDAADSISSTVVGPVPPPDAADSLSATVVGPVPSPDAADSLSATTIGSAPDPGDSLGATTIRRAGDDPGSSGTFPVAGSGSFPAADSGTFPAASSGTFPELRDVGAQDSSGARPPAGTSSSREAGPHPAASRSGAPVPKDSSTAATGTSTGDGHSAPVPGDSRNTPVPGDSRNTPVPGDSRSAPVPGDIGSASGPINASVAGRPDPAAGAATSSRAATDDGTRATAPLYAAAPSAVIRRVVVPADSPYIHGPSDSQAGAAPQDPGAALSAPALASSMRAELLSQRLAPARQALAQARERDRITAALVQGAIQIAARVALFGVKREGLRALAAPGSALQLPTSAVIPIPEGSLLDRAVLGQIRLKLLTEPRLADVVGRPLGIPCLFEPVYAQGRCVLMLYLDRDGGLFDAADHDAIRDLCELARGSLEALLRMMGVGAASRSAGVVLDSGLTRVHPSGPNPAADPAQPGAETAPADGQSTGRPGPGDSPSDAQSGPAGSQSAARPAPEDSRPLAARPAPEDSRTVPTTSDRPDSRPLPVRPAPENSQPVITRPGPEDSLSAPVTSDRPDSRPLAARPAPKDTLSASTGPGADRRSPPAPSEPGPGDSLSPPAARTSDGAPTPTRAKPVPQNSLSVAGSDRAGDPLAATAIEPVLEDSDAAAIEAAPGARGSADRTTRPYGPAAAEPSAPIELSHGDTRPSPVGTAARTRESASRDGATARPPAGTSSPRTGPDSEPARPPQAVPPRINTDNEPTRPLPAARAPEEPTRIRPLRGRRQVIALVNPIRRDSSDTTMDAHGAGRDDAGELPPATAWLAKPAPTPALDSREPGLEDSTPLATNERAGASTSGESAAGDPREQTTEGPVTDRDAATSAEPVSNHTRDAATSDEPVRNDIHDATTSGEPVRKDIHAATSAEPAATDPRASAEPVPGDAATSAEPARKARRERVPAGPVPGDTRDAAVGSDEPVPQASTASELAPADDRPAEPSDDASPAPARTGTTAGSSAVLHLPNLVAPPGTRRAVGKKGERLRAGDAALVMPDLRRPGGPAAPGDASESGATLSIPASLIAPTPLPGARRRGSKTGQNPVVPGADEITLNMPRLVREDGERMATAPADAGSADLSPRTGETAEATVTDAGASGLLAIAHAELAGQATTADAATDDTTPDARPAVTDGETDSLSAGTGEVHAERMTTLAVDLAATGTSAGIGDSPASTHTSARVSDAETIVTPSDLAGAQPEAPASDLSDRTSEPATEPPAEPARGDQPAVDPDAAIENYLRDPTAADAIARLRAAGPAGLTRIAARFPGPIELGAQSDARSFPPPSAHGPLLRACIELGGVVTPHILDLVDHPRPQIRFYAAFLFQELRDRRSLRPLAAHAFDPDPDVRLIATRVLESYSRTPGFVEATEVVRTALRSRDRERVLLAAEAAGTLRDTHAVPVLIDLLSVRDKQVRETALESLCSITAKHHGYRPAKWKAWYAEHGKRTRLEWVIDALHHRDTAVRRWASDELVRITGHRIATPPGGEKPGARYVLAQWQAWFEANGANYP